MAYQRQGIVPTYLLSAIADNHKDQPVGEAAAKTIDINHKCHDARKQYFDSKLAQGYGSGSGSGSGGGSDAPKAPPRNIVPTYVLEHISEAEGVSAEVKESAQKTLAISRQKQDVRAAAAQPGTSTDTGDATSPDAVVQRGVYDMQNRDEVDDEGNSLLPGKAVRLEGQPAVRDHAVNEAFDNCGKVLQFYREIFNYNSLDGQGMPVVSSVHVQKNFGNAYWSPDFQQMVYGDGDGVFLYNFTASLDVIGHEMTHAVTEKNSQLVYQNEAGALNEHISDVFGIMVRQYVEKTAARQSDWLIGEGCLLPDVKGVALRNMKFPGTAYNDPDKIGKDPQPADFAALKAYKAAQPNWRSTDNGGVHLFSGLPNRAFALCAEAFDGYSWEKAGQIWWTTVTTNRISPRCTFLQFADATVDVAQELLDDDAAKIVRAAWTKVGIVRQH